MKRGWIAVFLIGCIFLLSYFADKQVEGRISSLVDRLEALEEPLMRGDMAICAAEAAEIETIFRKSAEWLGGFLPTHELDEVTEYLACLPTLAERGDAGGFDAARVFCLAKLRHIQESNALNWNHFL